MLLGQKSMQAASALLYSFVMTAVPATARVRPAAVSGLFYPADPTELRATVQRLLQADNSTAAQPGLKAIIAPHAGYVYSGPIAASVYRLLPSHAERIRRVVMIGPSHRVGLVGMAVPEMDAFETPLGAVRIDTELRDLALRLKTVQANDLPHADEHSLEVQLPFLQSTLRDFTLLPLAAGSAIPEEIAAVLEDLWGGPETLIVISTDLSHYQPYALARSIDDATQEAILDFSSRITGRQACGYVGLNGFLACAHRHELRIEPRDLRNSGDTAGDRARVVGYGAWALYDA